MEPERNEAPTERIKKFDLEDRLLDYAVAIIQLVDTLRADTWVRNYYAPERPHSGITGKRRRRNRVETSSTN